MKAGDDARVLWLCAVLIVVSAYAILDSSLQRRINASRETTASYYAQIVANRRIVAEAARLARVQRRVDADLAALHDREAETPMSELLGTLQQTAAKHGVEIQAVEPQKTVAPSRDTDFPARALVGQDVTLRASSTFADLLAFLQGLSLNRTLLEVTGSELRLAGSSAPDAKKPARLEVTIQAKLYALRTDAEPLRATP